jgi:hypothetical protein
MSVTGHPTRKRRGTNRKVAYWVQLLHPDSCEIETYPTVFSNPMYADMFAMTICPSGWEYSIISDVEAEIGEVLRKKIT